MSGILGVYNLDGRPIDAAILDRMGDAMAHRGPDGRAQWRCGAVGFGHLMFRTTPQSLCETQPLTNEEGNLCLTLDGRLDNRQELKKALLSRGFSLRQDTDAELVLRSYQCWQEQCPKRMIGDFAFAIWDARSQRLFCARDHMGVRPFYYHRSARLVAFATEIAGLLALDMIPQQLNESRLADYLVDELDREDQQSTFYRDITRLPPGHYLIASGDRFALHDYWELQPPSPLKLASFEEYGQAFREVFVEAVRCRLPSVHRVASTLSGGIDSSSVVCTVRELLAPELNEPLHTVSLVDGDESRCGETPYIKEVLQSGRIVPHIVRSDEILPHCARLRRALSSSQEPFDMAGYFSNFYAFAAARQSGARVLLDGLDGDLIIPHNHYVASLIRSRDWKTATAELAYFSQFGQTRWRSLLHNGLAPMLPNAYSLLMRFAHGGTTSWHRGVIQSDFAARTRVAERCEMRRSRLRKAGQDIGELHALSFTSGLLSFALEILNRMGAAEGIETRHPFADRRVIDFFLSLPLDRKVYTPFPKMVIRAGMQGVLPEKVRWRQQFSHPGPAFLKSLLRQESERVQAVFQPKRLQEMEPYVNVVLASAIHREYASSASDEAAWPVWKVVNLAAWLGDRQFVK